MHVLLVHQSFVDHDHPGGTRHYELAAHLVNAGHKVTIVAGNLGYLTGERFVESKRLVTEQTVHGIRILRAYVYPSLHRSFIWRVVAFLSFMFSSVIAGLKAGPVDVVWGTSPPIFQLPSTWIISVIRWRPFLLEIRDLWPEFAVEMGVLKNRWLIALARWMERFFYARANHIIVNSPAYRDYLISRRVESDKISVVPNGVDPTMFDPNADGAKIRSELDLNGSFVATYAGALGPANDIETILRAAKRLKDQADIRFVLVGDGKERAKLEEFASREDLSNVVFAGTYPKSRMKEILAGSNACLATLQNIPMFKTTFPNKVFDYMAAGRPTILAIDGVIRNVVDQAQGGIFVPPGDDQALATAVRTLAGDPQRARDMGESARAYVMRHFDRQQHAEQLTNLLRQVAKRA